MPDGLRQLPLFSGPPLGVGMLSAGLILAIMVIPFTSSVAREVLKSVPLAQREGAYALGATRFEAIRAALFLRAHRHHRRGHARLRPRARRDDGRDDGDRQQPARSRRRSSRRSTRWRRSSPTSSPKPPTELYLHALVEIGLVLFIITLVVNGLSRLLIWSMARARQARRAVARRCRRRRRRHEPRSPPQAAVVAVRRLLRAVGAGRARAARLHPVLRRQPGHPARSTSTSSRRCRSRSASPAAAWPTPSSAR